MLYTLRFFFSKCSLFHNANLFGSCIIHILYTGCAKIKKKQFRRQRVNDHLHRFNSHKCQTEKYLSKSHCRHIIFSFIPEDRNKICVYLFRTFENIAIENGIALY